MHNLVMLRNNIRFLTTPIAGTETITLMVMVKVGSRNEDMGLEGAAHYIEHLLFKGTKKYQTTQILSRELDAIGAEFNAFTGKEYTVYYIKSSAHHIKKTSDILFEMINHSLFDSEEMEREKTVIIEEIKMYHENPLMHSSDLFESYMYEGSRLGLDIAGTKESVSSFDRETVLDFKRKTYTKDAILVCASGKIDDDIREHIKTVFEGISCGDIQEYGHQEVIQPELSAPRIGLEYRDIEQAQLSLGFFGLPYGHQDMPVLQVLSSILGGNMSSRLFISIRERKGLCYSVGSALNRYADVGTFKITAGLGHRRIQEALGAIKEEVDLIRIKGITKEELQRAKDNFEGRLAISLEDSFEIGFFYGIQELRLGLMHTPQELLEAIMSVSLEQVNEMARILDTQKSTLTLIGPYKDKDVFRNILQS